MGMIIITSINNTSLIINHNKTLCDICNASCGMSIKMINNNSFRAIGIEEHPFSQGYLCPKGLAVNELVNSPERIQKPLFKQDFGEWLAISWERAFSILIHGLKELKEKHGAESMAVHVGRVGVRKEFAAYWEAFCRLYGTPNYSTAGSHCHLSKTMANIITCGVLPVPDFQNSDCIVLWGSNPAISVPPDGKKIRNACKRGAKLIVIDPQKTPMAKKADIHLQLRPGTDGALALGIIHTIIERKLYNANFVEKWTIGFGQLCRHVQDYPPEKVEIITGVPASKIREAARLYAEHPPACISIGIAVELQTNGFQASRAISILQAICGNLDIRGGALFPPGKKLSPLFKTSKNHQKPAIGEKEFPLFYKMTQTAQANIYTRAILDHTPYPLKGLIVVGSNPVLTWPNAGLVKKAFSILDFLVVVDHFMTETARLAKLVLPVTTFLGRNELYDYSTINGEARIFLAPKVLDENLPTDWILCKILAERMGFSDFLPWTNEEEAINYRLKALGISLADLKGRPSGFLYDDWQERKYLIHGFNTPSGKVELYSKELEDYGYAPLPVFDEPAESPYSTPGLASSFPLILTTGARTMPYMHSRFHNIPSLRKLSPEPLVELHPEKARELGIEEGEMVRVESIRGALTVKAKFNQEIEPGIIFIPHGWEEANANLLTNNEKLDPITGFPGDRALLARISKT